MDFNPETLSSQYGEYGDRWADCKAAAEILSRSAKALRAKIALEKFPSAGSAAKAELMADASEEYNDQCKLAIDAQKQENLAWIRFEQIKVYIDLIRSQESTRREEMRLGR
jgi:hypothetical protein